LSSSVIGVAVLEEMRYRDSFHFQQEVKHADQLQYSGFLSMGQQLIQQAGNN